MKTIDVRRLDDTARPSLVAHYLALPVLDRWLRFGRSLAPAGVASYIDRIDFQRDAVFGVDDQRLGLVGVAHVALDDSVAEVALSVLPAHRRRGIASAMFGSAMAHARARRISRLFMQFLADNVPILRIARRFDMAVYANDGNAEAHLRLASPAGLSDALQG
jgi:GNAT superfamily N-acetyltransferase